MCCYSIIHIGSWMVSPVTLSHYFTETPIRLHKCHKRELQEIRREEIDELREKVIEMEEMQKKQNENEKTVDMMADI